METAENNEFVYEFGRFVLDPKERTLFADNTPMHLPAKEFDTLLLLVENNGKALSKEEMMSAIWQDSFVEESNLAKQISLLRKILNTNGKEYIETIPKHGYRFSADVRLKISQSDVPVVIQRKTVKRLAVAYENQPEVPLPATPMQLHGNRRRSYPLLPLVSGVLLAGLLAVGLFWWFSTRPSEPGTAAAVKTVAVLPFRSLGPEDDEYLRSGLTDALIMKLGNLKRIVVRSTNSVGKQDVQNPLAAGRELGVEAVLDGSVQRIGEHVRVFVQLISVSDGTLLWSGKFDQTSSDILSLQDEISEQVAKALAPGLTNEETSLLAKRYTTNPEAHAAYVRGRFFWNRRTGADLKEAVKYFNEAVGKDPAYALAYVGLADTYSLLADYSEAPSGESYARAREAALRALELDDKLAEAHTSLAYVNMYYYWDWKAAEDGYRRAISINPNYATAHQWYSEYLTAMGRFDEALAEIRQAREIDPLSPAINAGEAWMLYFARRCDEAIEQGRKVVEMNPQFAEIHEYLKRCYDQKGMYREAIASRQMRRKLAGFEAQPTSELSRAATAKTPHEYWNARLAQEFEDMKTETPVPFDLAEIYAQLGEKDKAFEWLEKALANRVYMMMYLKVASNLDPLRSDTRFADMLRRVSLQ